MKTLQISRQFFPSVGGLENVTLGLTRSLNNFGHRADVLTLKWIFNLQSFAASTELYEGFSIFRIPHIGIKRYPIAPAVFSFLTPYDIIHVHAIDFFVDFLSCTKNFHKKPIIINTHGGIFHTRWLRPVKHLYFNTVTRLSLWRSDAVICDSQHDFELFRRVVHPDKLHIVGNGVDLEPFASIEKRIEPGLLLGIGRIAENKGIDRVIELLPGLVSDFPEVKLVWIGEDFEGRVPSLVARAKQLGVADRVQFLGKVDIPQMREVLSRAHLFVSAATYEAFGVSTIEAMSSGTIPVVSRVGVHPEVIEQGRSGFICSYDASDGLSCLRKVLALPDTKLQEIGENARAAASKYSWDNVVNSYIKIYQDVLAKSRTRRLEA